MISNYVHWHRFPGKNAEEYVSNSLALKNSDKTLAIPNLYCMYVYGEKYKKVQDLSYCLWRNEEPGSREQEKKSLAFMIQSNLCIWVKLCVCVLLIYTYLSVDWWMDGWIGNRILKYNQKGGKRHGPQKNRLSHSNPLCCLQTGPWPTPAPQCHSASVGPWGRCSTSLHPYLPKKMEAGHMTSEVLPSSSFDASVSHVTGLREQPPTFVFPQ